MADSPIFPGFDPAWDSIPDYVLGATWDLWEGRGLGTLATVTADNIIVRDAANVTQGLAAHRQDVLNTLVMFPDIELLGEDVIWCPTEADKNQKAGFHASHRVMTVATHTGDGFFGPATGNPVRFRTITDSWCCDNQTCDRWSVRDTGAIVRQIKHDPHDWVAAQLDSGGLPMPLTPDTDTEGPYFGHGDMAAPAAELNGVLKDAMAGDLSVFATHYDRACALARPGGAEDIGVAAAERFWLGLRAAFPSAAFRVEHATGVTDPSDAPRAALRWSLYGKHDGPGMFGPPSGCFVYVMGITHAEYGPRGIRREWTLIDECAVWAQILGAPA